MPKLPPRIRPSTPGRTGAWTGGAWSRRGVEPTRLRGRHLDRARQQLFDRQPLCVHCLAQGLVTKAEVRDHVIPLSEGGLEITENTQGLCVPCHDRKSEAERRR